MNYYEDILRKVYKEYLAREPDTEEFSHYLSLLENGKLNEDTLREQLVQSKKYEIKQLALQYESSPKIKSQINGKTFFVNSNNREFWAQLQVGLWEPYTFKIFDEFLDFNHSYIDIGAWIGPTVLYGCQKAKFCYAIEPDPIAFKNLKKNIQLNPNLLSRISLSNQCITDSCGKTYLTPIGNDGGDSMSSTIFKKSSKSWEVTSITLQQFMLENSINDCNFIKIDIEGGEFSVLPSMTEFLNKEKPTLHLSLHPPLMTNPKNEMEKIFQVIKRYDYVYSVQLKEIDKKSILDEENLNKFFEIVVSQRRLDSKES